MKKIIPFSIVILSFLFLTISKNTQAQITGAEQDCPGAIKICDGVLLDMQHIYYGNGTVDDLGNGTCLTNKENNSVWFYFDVDSAGMVVFSINPKAGDDYDFALFKLDNNETCSDIAGNTFYPVRCSYASFSGATGLMVNPPGNTSFLPEVQAQQGEKYYLVVDNFNTGGGGYTIDFTGTTAKFNSAGNCRSVISSVEDDKQFGENVAVYPNPAYTHLNIAATLPNSEAVNYEIISLLGETVVSGNNNANKFNIDVSTLAAGIYFIRLQSNKGSVVKRWVKE
jgi:hypothetical protein